MADKLASLGYLVLIPDLFSGDAAPDRSVRSKDWSFDEWLGRHGPEVAQPIVDAVLKGVRDGFSMI